MPTVVDVNAKNPVAYRSRIDGRASGAIVELGIDSFALATPDPDTGLDDSPVAPRSGGLDTGG